MLRKVVEECYHPWRFLGVPCSTKKIPKGAGPTLISKISLWEDSSVAGKNRIKKTEKLVRCK